MKTSAVVDASAWASAGLAFSALMLIMLLVPTREAESIFWTSSTGRANCSRAMTASAMVGDVICRT